MNAPAKKMPPRATYPDLKAVPPIEVAEPIGGMLYSGGTATAQTLPLPMSVEAWADMEEDAPGELVDGCLVEEEVPDFKHEGIVAWLVIFIGAWILPRGGLVFPSESKYAVRPKGGRKPDVSVYLPGSPAPPSEGPSRVPPDIMVEVISRHPSDARRDRIDKPLDYAAFGVRYYWLIDPVARTVEVFELQAAGRYLRLGGASQGLLDVPGCPDLRLDLDGLWAYVGRLAPPRVHARPKAARASRKTKAKR